MFPTFTNVIFMYLQMKSSCVSRNIYSHLAGAQRGPCGPWPAAAGQGLAARPAPRPDQDLGPGEGVLRGSPSPRHWARGWGQGQAQARLGHGPMGGPGSARPMAWLGRGWNGALGCRRRGEGSRGWAGAGRAISASWP